jgi:hypothetical protein
MTKYRVLRKLQMKDLFEIFFYNYVLDRVVLINCTLQINLNLTPQTEAPLPGEVILRGPLPGIDFTKLHFGRKIFRIFVGRTNSIEKCKFYFTVFYVDTLLGFDGAQKQLNESMKVHLTYFKFFFDILSPFYSCRHLITRLPSPIPKSEYIDRRPALLAYIQIPIPKVHAASGQLVTPENLFLVLSANFGRNGFSRNRTQASRSSGRCPRPRPSRVMPPKRFRPSPRAWPFRTSPLFRVLPEFPKS